MALNNSGPISLAGPVAGESIALTILQSPTRQISLNDTNVRTLSGVTTPNSQITIPTNFWGKAWHATLVDVFMMGGGGSGGSPYGGSAGGGQMRTVLSSSVTPFSTYPIVVGGVGSSSSFNGISAIAGGSGGSDFVACGSGGVGGNGACGGGGGADCGVTDNCSGGIGSVGYNGGAGRSVALNSAGNGGGGGLGSAGGNAYRSGSTNYGGNGGASVVSTFTLSSITYGGGAPGSWFCGSGDPQQSGNWYDSGYGPNTGYGTYSGVVIIRVQDNVMQPSYTGSCTFSQYGGYFWFKFTGSGSITF